MLCADILEADDFDVMLHSVDAPKRFPSLTLDRRPAAGLWTFVENHFRIERRMNDQNVLYEN